MKSSYRFLKVPLCLFSDSYSQLSVEAKILYAFLLDRLTLSEKNGFSDEDAVCLCTIRTARCAERFAADLKRRRGYFVSLKNTG